MLVHSQLAKSTIAVTSRRTRCSALDDAALPAPLLLPLLLLVNDALSMADAEEDRRLNRLLLRAICHADRAVTCCALPWGS
jgi:hypothetical protein